MTITHTLFVFRNYTKFGHRDWQNLKIQINFIKTCADNKLLGLIYRLIFSLFVYKLWSKYINFKHLFISLPKKTFIYLIYIEFLNAIMFKNSKVISVT